MSKTDKELTAEIVINAFANWNFSHGATSEIKNQVLITLLKNVHSTLKQLKD